MDYAAEQEMELEALQAILMDDLTCALHSRFQLNVHSEVTCKRYVQRSYLLDLQLGCMVKCLLPQQLAAKLMFYLMQRWRSRPPTAGLRMLPVTGLA